MSYEPLTLTAALLAGLLGSAHCLGMCGGISGALGMGTARRGRLEAVGYALTYNLGRISSYALAGAIAGGFGLWLGNALNFSAWSGLLRLASGLLLVAIGLQLAVNWRGLRHIEALGSRLWRRLAPLSRRLLPVRNPLQAYAAGLIWGWMPCGLVYTMLIAAAVSGGVVQGAAVLGAFGLGTLPALVAAGAAAQALRRWTAHRGLRRIAGTTVLLFGLWTMAAPQLIHSSHAAGDPDCTAPASH